MASIIANKEKTYRPMVYAIFFILFGAVLLAISVKEMSTYAYKNENYIKTEAKVIKHTYKDGKVVSSVLEYNVGEDRFITESKDKLDCIKSYGSNVNIKYNPSNPEEIIFSDRNINIVIPVMALVMLSIGLSITIVMISEGIIRMKRISKAIAIKNSRLNSYNNFNNISSINNNAINDNVNIINNVVNTYNSSNDINNIDLMNNTISISNDNNINEINVLQEVNNEVGTNNDASIDVPFVSEDNNKQILNDYNQNYIDEVNSFDNYYNNKHFDNNVNTGYNNIDYIQFISETNNIEDTLNFIPNIDVLNKKSNK